MKTDYLNFKNSTWCPGCAAFSVQSALAQALAELKIEPHQTAMVFDIGCFGNACVLWRTYGFHGLHGRTLPTAIGAKLANPKLTVIGLAGDGGAYGEGVGHLIEAARANFNVTLIVGNNHLYSLTKGQASPTMNKGTKTKSTPYGLAKEPLNPLAVALAAKAGFVARGYADETEHLKQIFKKAIKHPGFSLVDVLQPCITLDKTHTRQWYKQRIYKLGKKWPVKDIKTAMAKVRENNQTIPIGIFLRQTKATYQEQISLLKNKPPLKQVNQKGGLDNLVKEFRS